MQLSDLINVDAVACDIDVSSKKRALEQLSELISQNQTQVTPGEVFDSLLSRERLGSTGIGHGIAIPHGRMEQSEQAIGAFVRLSQAVDFDAIDGQPVDLLFALIVPAESTQEHLQILSLLASMFNDAAFRDKLRQAKDNQALYNLLTEWQQPN